MPNRIVREGILTSERVEKLDWPAEVFYRRLLSKVDDHGLYDARPSILRASLYPLRLERVREAECSRWMAMCQKAGLLRLYESNEKPYLQVLDTRWPVRSEPKYPLPTSASTCAQVNANAELVVVEDVVVVVDEDVGKPLAASAKAPLAEGKVNGNAVCHIPLNDGTEYGISAEQVGEFEKLYPAVDVPQTLNEIRGWNLARPHKRKTRRGVLAHVTGWLAREQNRG